MTAGRPPVDDDAMDHSMTAPAPRTSAEQILLVLVAAGFACAPVSWIVDGITPSWVVYPIALAVGLWRRSRGGGTLYFGIAATVFLLVHLPWTWAAVSGSDTNPLDSTLPSHPVEWVVTLFAIPLLTAAAGFAAYRAAAWTPTPSAPSSRSSSASRT
jgi:hypothetical protein